MVSDYHLVEDTIVTQGKALAKCEVLAVLTIFLQTLILRYQNERGMAWSY